MKKLIIRAANEEDYPQIYAINTDAFGQADESNLIALLKKNSNFIAELSLVGLIDNQIVAYILYTKIEIINDLKESNRSLALAPMAVSTKFQKQNLGSQLIKHSLEKVAELGFESVIVLGHEKYYPKFGFVAASKWNIKAPFDVPDNVFMALEINNGSLNKTSGVVKYPTEFNIV